MAPLWSQAMRTGCLDLMREVIIFWKAPALNKGVQKMIYGDLGTKLRRGDRNGIVLHGDTKFHFLFIQQNPVLITAGAVRFIGADYTS